MELRLLLLLLLLLLRLALLLLEVARPDTSGRRWEWLCNEEGAIVPGPPPPAPGLSLPNNPPAAAVVVGAAEGADAPGQGCPAVPFRLPDWKRSNADNGCC